MSASAQRSIDPDPAHLIPESRVPSPGRMSLLLLLSRPNKQNQACPWPLCAVTYAVRLVCLAIAGRRPLTYQGRGQMAPSVSEFSARVKAHVARSFALGTAPFRLNLFFRHTWAKGSAMSQTCRGLCRSGARRHVDQAKRCYWGPGNPGARFGRIRASETEEPDPGGGARQRTTQCVLLLEMKSTNRSNASPLKGTIVSPTHALRNFYLLARHGTKCKSRPP